MLNLYATTKSERAEKGQGGAEYLDIKINCRYQELVRLLVKPTPSGGVSIHYSTGDMRRWKELRIYSPEELPPDKRQDTITFHCAGCDIDETWTAREIAEKGTPICPKCDEDMIA